MRSDLQSFGKNNRQKEIKKKLCFTKGYGNFTWEWSTTFTHDGLRHYHYTMMSTMEAGNKLQDFNILFCVVPAVCRFFRWLNSKLSNYTIYYQDMTIKLL
jgi:hypothetical protein